MKGFAWEHIVGLLGLAVLVYGQYYALAVVPGEQHMGEASRILYVHVPSAWNAGGWYAIAFLASLGFLVTGWRKLDFLQAATLEVAFVLSLLLTAQGSIFARPTWGVWWTWDPRLTSTAVLLVSFAGVLVLRSLVANPDRRAMWTAVAAIVSFVNVPIVYMSVRWWRSMHQIQTAPTDVDDPVRLAWRINVFAFLMISAWFVARRYRLEAIRSQAEAPDELPERLPTQRAEVHP